jgi:hypothetical protein
VISCLSCAAETSNGLALCERCRIAALVILEFLPAYFRNLARWRPGRAGSRQVPGSRVLYDGPRAPGTGDRISDALDEAKTMLITRARELAKDRPHFQRPLTLVDAVLCDDLPAEVADALNEDPAKTVALLCTGFERHLASIATLDWCGDFVRDLTEHEERLRGLTETAIPGWYAGACRRCGRSTYVVPGLTWLTCDGCGTTTHAADHLETILTEARDWVARPLRLAEAAVALIDTEMSTPRLHDRIRQWSQRERIVGIRKLDTDGDPVGPKRYRFGDVLDLILADATRPELESVPSAADAS